MSDSILQVNKIQDKTGNADGITIANTSANVTIGNLTATSLAGGNITSAVTGFAGIKEIDSWRITSNLTTNANGVFPATANWERDDTGQASQLLGTGMTQSSGVFTFPSTGIWWIIANGYVGTGTTGAYAGWGIQCTTDNSSYVFRGEAYTNTENGGEHSHCCSMTFFDVTNVSTHKCRFVSNSATNGFSWHGTSTGNKTGAMFFRMGDT